MLTPAVDSATRNYMTIEEIKAIAPETKPDEIKLAKEQPADAKKISVDIGAGVTVELDIEQGKKYIQYRDSRSKSYKEIETKLKSAEEATKSEAARAQLMESIKNQNLEQVEEQVSAKYKDTISKFEKKVYNSTIESALSKMGVLPEALSDATKLVLADAKAELTGEEITLNGIKVDDYLKEWTSKKQHLVAAKVAQGTGANRTSSIQTKQLPSGKERLASGVSAFIKNK